ncbi:MAG TPA: DUF3052 domain-containing protein [Acidimicrobiales bacterium]|nr:DUF3052 domain-containing protein [Acidimicrobiales bacterium]
MAGYSGTPLAKKLGIKDGSTIALSNAPPTLDAELDLSLLEGVVVRPRLKGPLDVVLVFVKSLSELEHRFPPAQRALHERGGLWVAWPKRTSGVATDLTENVVRDVGLRAGLVDTKVCAVDDTWSGLRFVYRLRDRSGN